MGLNRRDIEADNIGANPRFAIENMRSDAKLNVLLFRLHNSTASTMRSRSTLYQLRPATFMDGGVTQLE